MYCAIVVLVYNSNNNSNNIFFDIAQEHFPFRLLNSNANFTRVSIKCTCNICPNAMLCLRIPLCIFAYVFFVSLESRKAWLPGKPLWCLSVRSMSRMTRKYSLE